MLRGFLSSSILPIRNIGERKKKKKPEQRQAPTSYNSRRRRRKKAEKEEEGDVNHNLLPLAPGMKQDLMQSFKKRKRKREVYTYTVRVVSSLMIAVDFNRRWKPKQIA